MNHSLVMTVLGPDRPGLLEKLSATIDAHGGSWFESRLAQFAGYFAGILRFDCPDDQHDALLEALDHLAGLEVKVVREVDVPKRVTKKLNFNVMGNHHTGLVRQIAATITRAGGNMEELISERDPVPVPGHVVFRAIGTVSVVKDFDETKLIDALQALGSDLSVSVTEASVSEAEEVPVGAR